MIIYKENGESIQINSNDFTRITKVLGEIGIKSNEIKFVATDFKKYVFDTQEGKWFDLNFYNVVSKDSQFSSVIERNGRYYSKVELFIADYHQPLVKFISRRIISNKGLAKVPFFVLIDESQFKGELALLNSEKMIMYDDVGVRTISYHSDRYAKSKCKPVLSGWGYYAPDEKFIQKVNDNEYISGQNFFIELSRSQLQYGVFYRPLLDNDNRIILTKGD
jgi:hypothetical protein